MNYKEQRILIDTAITYGYHTAKEFSKFLKRYNPDVMVNERGRNIIQFSLFT